jgi:ribonuclease-3
MPRRSERFRTPSTTSTSTPPSKAERVPRREPPVEGQDPAAELASRLRLPVRDLALLRLALTHSSYLHEHPEVAGEPNERLEYLGDAVVSLIVSEALYARHPEDDEGLLSARRAVIVSTHGLARLGSRLGLGAALLLGEGEASRSSRTRPSLLASAFEALVGALYLDLGFAAVRAWFHGLAAPELEQDLPVGLLKSPKSLLQEHTQRSTGGRPVYRLVDATGPDHDRIFQVEVEVGGRVLGEGRGPSRRVAETAAALVAIEALRAGR